jgi:hypothetical protein
MTMVLCKVCGSEMVPGDDLTSKISIRIFCTMRCKYCGLAIITNPREDFSNLYNEDYYKGKTGSDDYFTEVTNQSSIRYKNRLLEYSALLSILKSRCSDLQSISVLDYGGGLGGLTRYLNRLGVKAELSDYGFGLDFAKSWGTPIVLEPNSDSYDIIFAIEVIEHMTQFELEIPKLVSHLKDGGYLILTTGNLQKYVGSLRDWKYARIPDVHVVFWTPMALKIEMAKHGLIPITISAPSELIQFKVINAVYFKRFFYYSRHVWKFLTPNIDRKFGVSEMMVWKKSN